jgi:general bacterial porin, GBP family
MSIRTGGSVIVTGLLLAAPGAHAQGSVVLYGVVEVGAMYKTNADAKGDSATSLTGGNRNANRFGLRVDEDLGGGVSATVRLESPFNAGSGSQLIASSYFSRESTVGLKDASLGWVELGRNWIPFHDTLSTLDTTGFTNFGSLSTLSYQNLSGSSTALTGAGYYWANNSVKYTSPKLFGAVVSGLYSFGGKAGDFQNQELYSANVTYELGQETFSAGYIDARDPTGLTDASVARSVDAGLRWHFTTAVEASVTYANYRDPAIGSNQTYYAFTGKYLVVPDVQLLADYFLFDDSHDSRRNANLFKLEADYLASKRSILHAMVGYVANHDLGTVGLLINAPTPAGKNQLAVGIGIVNSF